MKTLGSVAALALLACVNVSLSVGCGCEAANNSYRAPVTFNPSAVAAVRTPATCGVNNPSYTLTDTFSLSLTGETDIVQPFTNITIDMRASSLINVATPLMVSADSSASAASAKSNDGAITFSFTSGTDPTELDSNPIDAVVVTVTSLPAEDGASLSAELSVTFQDGRVLDQVYTAPVATTSVVCSH